MTDDEREAQIRNRHGGAVSSHVCNEEGSPSWPACEQAFLLRRLNEQRARAARFKEDRDYLDEEIADLRRTFELMWDADQRAIKVWQNAHPGSEMVWPDRSKLTLWLLERYDNLVAERAGR